MPSPRTLRSSSAFTPKSVPGLALWLDASRTGDLYTTDAGPVTAVSSPTEISGCALWLDGADSSAASMTLSGSLVETWKDKSGNGRNFTASGSARPTLTAAALNGNSVVTFDGTDDQMLHATNFMQVANCTILAVFRRLSGTYGGVISSAGGADSSPSLVIDPGSAVIRGAGNASISTASATTSFTVMSGVVSASASSAFTNGLLYDSDAASGTLDTTQTTTALGTYRQSAANFLNGQIAEIVVFLSALSTADRARVEAYLAAKWGISGVHRSATQEIAAVASPAEIAGLSDWYDAADASTVTLSGSKITSWASRATGGRTLTQASDSLRPVLTSSVQNGLPMAKFDGVDDFIRTATPEAFGDKTVFIVARPTDVAATQAVWGASKQNITAYGYFYTAGFRVNSAAIVVRPETAGASARRIATSANEAIIISLQFKTSELLSNNFASTGPYRNGILFDSNDSVVLSDYAIGSTMGANDSRPAAGVLSNFYSGFVGEVLIYDSYLSSVDRARVEKYLQQKWGTATVPDPTPPVGYWRDRSGNNRHATQSTTANRPTISADKQGGRTAVAFASNTKSVTSPATVAQYVADATTSPKMFFAWVARPEGGLAGVTFGTAPTNPNSSSRVFFASDYGSYGSHIVDFGSIGGARLSGVVGDEGNNVGHVYSAYRDGSVVSVRRDGVEILRKTNASGSYTATSGTLSLNIAEAGSGTASWMEFMAYAASMPAASIARLERYLAAKWGITIAPQVSNADAQDWINRVYANGGTVSASTASAVNKFCNDIDSAGIRDRFYRLGLFAGAGLNAALVPLFRTWKVYSGRNLLSAGDNLSTSAWTKSGVTVTQSSSERPFAYGPYANVVTATAGTSVTPYVVAAGVTGFGTVTYSAYLKANGQNNVRILPIATAGQTFPGGGTVAYANINLATGAISNVLAGTSATATDVGNGWWRLAYTVTNNGTGQTSLRFDIGNGNPYNAAGTESVFIWGVQNEVGSAATDFDPYPLGNTTDTNVGPFVSGDYVETGASGGLTGNGSSKYLNTGVPGNAMTVANRHLSCYEITRDTGTYKALMGTQDNGAGTYFYALENLSPGTSLSFHCGTQATLASQSSGAHWIGSDQAASAMSLYKNGASAATSSGTNKNTPSVQPILVFALNQLSGSVSAAGYSSSRLGGYSMGLSLSDSQAAAYYTAMQAFQTALGRNV